MAIKYGLNGLAALKKLGVEQSWIDWLQGSNSEVKLTNTQFTFSNGGVSKHAAVSLDTLHKLNQGTISAPSKAMLKASVLHALGELKKVAELGSVTVAGEDWKLVMHDSGAPLGAPPAGSLLDKLPPLTSGVVTGPTVPPSNGWGVLDLASIGSTPAVKLRDATKLYQPVHGTSQGSRYFLVAANKDVRVAARLQGGQLSIRIEGPAAKKFASCFSACGFSDFNDSKGYTSMHLAVGADTTLAGKTLGAVLLGLGLPFETPIPDANIIAKAE